MRNFDAYRLYCMLCVVLTVFVTCSNNYNPFEDAANARLVIKSMSFHEQETLEIFSAETVHAVTTVRELLDSFTIHIDNNRIRQDTCFKGPLIKERHTFYLSIYDTGKQSVVITSYPKGAAPAKQIINFFTTSPLKPVTAEGASNMPILLTSPAKVKDDNVFYRWDIGDNLPHSSKDTALLCTLFMEPAVTKGFLWVEDESHTYLSPKVPYTLKMKDIKAPVIYCLNKPRNDTVSTGDSSLSLLFRIYDQDNYGIVDTATINGNPFSTTDKNDRLYSYEISAMTLFTKNSPFPAVIFARDNKQFPNDTSRTFYCYFDSTLAPQNGVRILISNVTGTDTINFMDTLFPVFGQVKSKTKQRIIMHAYLNNAEAGNQQTIDTGTGEWKWFLYLLPRQNNSIRIAALDTGGKIKAAETFIVYHNNNFNDMEKPILAAVQVNDAYEISPDTFITGNTCARIRVTAFDRNSGIERVSVNGKNAIQSTGALDWVYDSVTGLAHGHAGNPVTVEAEDRSKNHNKTKKKITVIQNNPPVIRIIKPFGEYVVAESSDTAYYSIEDKDPYDTVSVKIVSPVNSLTIQNTMLIWKPQKTDTGKKTITLRISDGYHNGTVESSWEHTVVLPWKKVEFLTNPDSIADSLEPDKDSLSAILRIKSSTGKPPYCFTVLNTFSGTVLLNTSTRNSTCPFAWLPKTADIGINRLRFTVTDSFAASAMFICTVAVFPESHFPCSLRVYRKNLLLNDKDSLVLVNAIDTASLTCIIRDQDPLGQDSFTITKSFSLNNSSQTFTSKDTVFTITIYPVLQSKRDTLSITVKDAEGSTALFTLFIRHPALREESPPTGGKNQTARKESLKIEEMRK